MCLDSAVGLHFVSSLLLPWYLESYFRYKFRMLYHTLLPLYHFSFYGHQLKWDCDIIKLCKLN